jgi:NadR type nicotinamide-nucleotide adenylyltransferase
MKAIKKLVAIGPESTGKSTLCGQLAEHYQTAWVPEYAREYLETNGNAYTYDDLLTIARGQINLEETIVNRQSSIVNKRPIFIDTDMYVMKVWCEFVFNKCHNWILNRIAERKYDGYLLCNVDLPWVEDNLREYPDLKTREKLYHIYKDIMINQSMPWVDISGSYDERLQKAKDFVNGVK